MDSISIDGTIEGQVALLVLPKAGKEIAIEVPIYKHRNVSASESGNFAESFC